MKKVLGTLLAFFLVISLTINAFLPSPALAAENSFLQGSNLGVWGVNGDGTINDSFMNNASIRTKAGAVLGVMRFPCRSFTATQLQSIANAIRNAGIEPLAILTAKNQSTALMQVNALKDSVTYFEFGNENNYFDGWSGATYASHWTSDIPVLRAAAPSAKFGGPVVSHFDASGSAYIRDFLNAIKGNSSLRPDFISAHVYAEHGEDTSNQAVLDKVSNQWGPGIDKIKSDVQSILGVSLPLAITEWNWDAAPENTSDNRDMNSSFMHDFTFKVLDTFKARGVWMSCQYDFSAGAGGGYLDMVTTGGVSKPQYNEFVNWKNANPPGSTPTPTPTPTPGGSSMEAEDMALTNYVVNTNTSASGGELIKLNASGVTGNAVYNFNGSTGTYDIKVHYYDENDGQATFKLYVGGTVVDQWIANQNLGSADPTSATLTSRTKNGVSVSNGAQIKIEAAQNAEEWGRVDKVELTLSGGSTPTPTPTPPPSNTTVRYEGENATGSSEVKTWPSGYSGSGIGVKWGNGAMTWSKNFAGGAYTFTVRCNDYNGTQTFTVQLDGVDIGGPFTMSTGDKSWKTFTGSFGNVSAGTHTIGVNFTSDASSVDLYCDYIDVTWP